MMTSKVGLRYDPRCASDNPPILLLWWYAKNLIEQGCRGTLLRVYNDRLCMIHFPPVAFIAIINLNDPFSMVIATVKRGTHSSLPSRYKMQHCGRQSSGNSIVYAVLCFDRLRFQKYNAFAMNRSIRRWGSGKEDVPRHLEIDRRNTHVLLS